MPCRLSILVGLLLLLGGSPSGLTALAIRRCPAAAATEVLVGSADNPGVFSEKRIEDIQVGDEVWTRAEEDADAPLALKRVTAVEQHTAYDLQKVSIRGADGNVEILDVTDEHPFFTEDRGWVGAADLYIGELLVSPDGTTRIVIANADDQRPEGITVYNFTVEGDHTYFVADGQGTADEFVWVHNSCNPLRPGEITTLGKGQRLKGNSVVIILKLKSGKSNSTEVKQADRLMDELDALLVDKTADAPAVGSLEGHEYAAAECRVFLSCPSADALVEKLRPWLTKLDWAAGFKVLKRYGEYVDGEAPTEYVDI